MSQNEIQIPNSNPQNQAQNQEFSPSKENQEGSYQRYQDIRIPFSNNSPFKSTILTPSRNFLDWGHCYPKNISGETSNSMNRCFTPLGFTLIDKVNGRVIQPNSAKPEICSGSPFRPIQIVDSNGRDYSENLISKE